MTAIRKLANFDVGSVGRDTVELSEGSVFVVGALDGQNRAPDVGQAAFNIPGAEIIAQPYVVPTAKRPVHIGVMARQARAKIRGLIRNLRGLNIADGDVFDDDMRRAENHSSGGPRAHTLVQDCDRGTIALPEKDWIANRQSLQQFRKSIQSLSMHVVGAARLSEGVGKSIAVARIDQGIASACRRETFGEVLPERDRT